MLTRAAAVLLCVLSAYLQSCSGDPLKGAIYITDGTANLELVAKVSDAAKHRPVVGATVTAIRSGRGTVLLASDSDAMPAPVATDASGRAVLFARFRFAASQDGSSVFVARSFLRVQAPGFRPAQVPISTIGRLDFAEQTPHYQATIPISLAHE